MDNQQLNDLTAERVMKWTRSGRLWRDEGGRPVLLISEWNPCEDERHATMVVDKMMDDSFRYESDGHKNADGYSHRALFNRHAALGKAYGHAIGQPTRCMAIVLAVLRTVGVTDEVMGL